MTHTIHRYGKVEDLENDYTIIYMTARGYNKAGSEPKIRKFLDLCVKHHAVNFGNIPEQNCKVDTRPDRQSPDWPRRRMKP
jgi:hypothetical protein